MSIDTINSIRSRHNSELDHANYNAIKQEQQVIKNTFVECKRKQIQWSEKIENLKYRQQRVSGKQKSEISQEIASCCKIHKQISVLAS